MNEMQGILFRLLHLFETSSRMGTEKDEPEGTRYVQISDTLVNLISAEIRQCLQKHVDV